MLRTLALIALTLLVPATAESASLSGDPLHDFRFVEFPRMVRELDRAIRFAEAEADAWSARVENYKPFQTFNEYAPTYTAEQSARLHLLSIEHRLERLYDQRARLNRYRRAKIRELKRQRGRSAPTSAAR